MVLGDGGRERRTHRDVTGRAATVNARRAVKIEESVTVHGPARELYDLWRDFSTLPRFMEHLESVVCTDDRHAHWVARMPGGKHIEWDSEIVNDIPSELIAWKTVGEPDVAHAGSVHFRRAGAGDETEVRLVLDYEPPAASMIGRFDGSLGEVPDALVRQELQRFKTYAEADGR